MSTPLTTSRLILRPWRPDDVDRFIAIYGDERVWKWLGATPAALTDPSAALARINRWAGLFDGACGIWAVVLHGSDEPVGTVLLLHLPDAAGNQSSAIEIGWHFAPDSWGHGYATEAAAVLLERAWEFGIEEVHAVIYPGNDASAAVAERLQLIDQGMTGEWYGVELRHFSTTAPTTP